MAIKAELVPIVNQLMSSSEFNKIILGILQIQKIPKNRYSRAKQK